MSCGLAISPQKKRGWGSGTLLLPLSFLSGTQAIAFALSASFLMALVG